MVRSETVPNAWQRPCRRAAGHLVQLPENNSSHAFVTWPSSHNLVPEFQPHPPVHNLPQRIVLHVAAASSVVGCVVVVDLVVAAVAATVVVATMGAVEGAEVGAAVGAEAGSVAVSLVVGAVVSVAV